MIFTSNEKRGIYTCFRCRVSITHTVWRRSIENAQLEGKAHCEPCQATICKEQ